MLEKIRKLIDDFYKKVGILPNTLVVNKNGMAELVEYSKIFNFNAHTDKEIASFLGLKVEVNPESEVQMDVKYVTERAES